MFDCIVVPLDGTPESASALPLARAVAGAGRSRLVLVRVVDPAVVSADERVELPPVLLERLKRIGDEMRSAGIEVDVRVSTGDVVAEILRVAESEHANAMIVATHTTALERLVDNSVAGRLVARSGLPVFVVRPGGRRVSSLRTLVAAVDGTPGSAQALDEAIALARLTGAVLVLVRVVPRPQQFGFDPLVGVTLGAHAEPGANERSLAVAEDYVNKLAERLRVHGIEATSRVMVGDAAERIVATAEQMDADLIVMSTHAYLAPLRGLLGSTADEVARSARRPVLLVRQRGVNAGVAARQAGGEAEIASPF